MLGYALLGLLARGDRSGYDLTQGLKDPVGYFWHAQHSQVYPELARLEGAGLVTHSVVEQAERPDKKVYRQTDAGRAALRAWLTADTEVPRKRDELVLKAYSMWQTEPARAADMLRAHARAHAAHLAEFERRLAEVTLRAGTELHDPRSPWFGIQAVLRRGIGYEREYRDWCEWLAGALDGAGQALSPTTP
ncbi:PadR family transcriptional regulator [Deinococcus metalli]|uniref:PadR family transcriptional regulator n=1 Tax=Deinococcus metalli TaxID=1141878 RepID=A0ABQ3JP79_9DEIO|nr:PadR family transcriptional regulator [Deinococcus metalli]